MNKNSQEVIKRFETKLKAKDISFNELYGLMKEMKKLNLDKSVAYNLLTDIRDSYEINLSEEQDDIILELLDVVTGFCSKHILIW